MEVNKNTRKALFEAIDIQIKTDDPKETKITLKRLQNLGYSEFESKQLIAQCVLLEMFNVFNNDETYNEQRYIRNLINLPDEPEE